MALTSTVYKASLSVIDIDRNYYADHALTLACHPSETTERMMVRLLAFALNAEEELALAAGMTDNDEPDVWLRDLTGTIEEWIEVGQPDEKRILKACGRSRKVKVYTYNPRPELWWSVVGPKVERAKNLSVFSIEAAATRRLFEFVNRAIDLQVTIQDGEIWVRNDSLEVSVGLVNLRNDAE
jgi:uncharacterized protein YaeQ